MSQLEPSLHREFARAGFRLTKPRRAVLDVFAEEGAHLVPEEILARGRARYPALSRPTVYRTLEVLAALNLIRPVWLNDGRVRYAVVADGHHHLVCTGCGSVMELPEADLLALEDDIRERFSFRATGHLLEVYGECRKCL